MTANQSTLRISASIAAVLLGILFSSTSGAQERAAPPPRTGGEFFMVSSVDAKAKQIVLKRPTEVTELIRISEKTVFLDDEGKKIQFEALRAGDTVWVTFSGNAQGVRTAGEIREGPMTIGELRRRYLKFE
jgi:hypothetical protein